MTVHGRRERKTGPRFALTVMRCATHGQSWTLYPPGHVPYGRVAVASLGPSGGSVTTAQGAPSLAGTLHEAAEDAARGVRWPESSGECPATRRTQGRRLRRVAALLGLLADARTQERVAHALSCPLLVLRDASAAYAVSRRWRVQAAAVMRVLAAARAAGRRGGLLRAGHEARLWGRPCRWDPGGARYVAPF